MSETPDSFNRRDFIVKSAAVAGALGAAKELLGRPSRALPNARIIGANDRINVGVIGVGGRGAYLAHQFEFIGDKTNACKVVAIADVYEKRKRRAAELRKCDGYLDYREVINRPDVDAVVVATPDHWHAAIALEAMDHGKDVYLEKPMCHTIEEAKQVVATVKEAKRVMQVGSQTTSGQQWHTAKKYIADGAIGKMIMSQGSYHRNSKNGEWNWDIDPDAGPDGKGENYIDWKTWLGKAPKRPYDADRFFRFRKYWDYSGGIATDLFFHVVAPLNICWSEPQFPTHVVGSGGIYVFKDEREVPDTFQLVAEFPKEHSLVLSSTMANSHHIPGLIRGHFGTIIMVENGMFERKTDHITLIPENQRILDAAYIAKFGTEETRIPVEEKNEMEAHILNFLDCMRTRQKPVLDAETAYHVQVTISMSVQSYREGRTLYWDDKKQKVSNKPIKA
jgi:predicted dehydrogenase